MRKLIIPLMCLLVAPAAQAQMPPATFDGPVGERILAQLKGTVDSVRTGTYVAPWASLKAGQYVNPTTGAVEGRVYGPQLW